MKKRTFIKNSSLIVTGGLVSPLLSCTHKEQVTTGTELKNWAGNLTYSTNNVHFAKSVEDVVEVVKKSESLRGLGSQHSFNKIADSKTQLLSLRELNSLTEVDEDNNTITVAAGVRYGDICEDIDRKGFALHNLASLPHISIAGACATSTHGSGVTLGSLATGASAIELVKADGRVIQVSKSSDPDLFNAAIIGLGAVGIVTKVTLDLLPSFEMNQLIYRNLPMGALENNFLEIMSSGYSVSLFTDWMHNTVNQIWIKSRVDSEHAISGNDYFGAKEAERNMHPVEDQSAQSCTDQMGVAGKWYDRLPHFKMGFTPSSGDELQAEYFVPLEHGYEAMVAVEQLNTHISPHLLISEIRTIAADDFWMSPFYKKPCVSIHFTFKPHWDAVQKIMPMVEKTLSAYDVRPHWGKLFSMSPALLQSRIARLSDYKELLMSFDPQGKFRNEFINKYLFGS